MGYGALDMSNPFNIMRYGRQAYVDFLGIKSREVMNYRSSSKSLSMTYLKHQKGSSLFIDTDGEVVSVL